MPSISRESLNRILDAAQASPRREICGLLLGRDGRILDILPAANVAREPECRFEIDPATLIGAHRRARDGAAAVLGHYHSHPTGEIVPSACDAEMAPPDGALWLICSTDRRHALWRAQGEGLFGKFRPLPLRVEASPAEASAFPSASLPLHRRGHDG